MSIFKELGWGIACSAAAVYNSWPTTAASAVVTTLMGTLIGAASGLEAGAGAGVGAVLGASGPILISMAAGTKLMRCAYRAHAENKPFELHEKYIDAQKKRSFEFIFKLPSYIYANICDVTNQAQFDRLDFLVDNDAFLKTAYHQRTSSDQHIPDTIADSGPVVEPPSDSGTSRQEPRPASSQMIWRDHQRQRGWIGQFTDRDDDEAPPVSVGGYASPPISRSNSGIPSAMTSYGAARVAAFTPRATPASDGGGAVTPDPEAPSGMLSTATFKSRSFD